MPKVMQYTKGSIPYFAGDEDERVFILQRGVVILTSIDIETGAPVTEHVKAGEFFGVKSALGHFPREETANVLSDSTAVCLTVPEFEKLFISNKAIIMKMLRVFSNQLRQIHQKTEAILNNVPEDQQTGMLNVAKIFFEEEQFRSCCDVCIKLLKRFPKTPYKQEISELYGNSRMCNEKSRRRAPIDDSVQEVADGVAKQFDLLMFERFAKNYESGEVIISEFEPGDAFYLILSGSVQLLKCVNGSQKNLDILKSGEFFGEMAILDNSPRSATCIARTKVKCLEFSKENFETLIMGNPQLALNLLKLFCKRIYDQKRRFRVLVVKDPQARLADVFLMLNEMYPSAKPDDKPHRFDVTIPDMGHWAGLEPDVVRDEMNRFVERRKIEIYDNYVIVNNLVDMRRIFETRSGAILTK
ncbi:MAG: Crp/Fnr family transcriptional regulator [Treponema sp.]